MTAAWITKVVRARLVLALLLPCSALSAADPFIGEWKLDIAQSDFGNALEPKSGKATYRLRRGGYSYESKTDYGDGYTSRLVIQVKLDGTPEPGFLDGRKVVFVTEKISRRSYRVIVSDKQTGEVAERFRYVVSPDEKTLMFSWLKSSREKPSQLLVYDKQ